MTEMMMICPKVKDCDDKCRNVKGGFDHSVPHESKYSCVTHVNDKQCRYNKDEIKCPPCIPYTLQKGDRVRILSKEGKDTIPSDLVSWKIGDIAYVSDVPHQQGKNYWLSKMKKGIEENGFFYLEDLEYIGKEDDMAIVHDVGGLSSSSTSFIKEKPKYKTTGKELTIENIYRSILENICKGHFQHFGDMLYSLRPSLLDGTVPLSFDRLIEWAEQDPKRIKWLIDKGYIEEVQSEYDKWASDVPVGLSGIGISKAVEWAKRMPREK